MASILVAGATGLLGKALTHQISSKFKVIGVSGSGRDGTEPCELSDKAQVERVLDQHHPDLLVNCAACSDVDGCERNPEQAYRSNATAVQVLAQACQKRKIPFIHVSTDYVFNGEKSTLYEVDDVTFPVNIYGLSKLAGEFYAETFTYQTCVIRTSWLFGKGPANNFVNAILARLKSDKKVGVLDDQIDSPTSAVDLAKAIEVVGEFLLALPADEQFFKKIQFCNKGETTRLAMTQAIKDFLHLKDVTVERVDASKVSGRLAVRPRRVPMSTRSFEESFKMPIRSWQESLKEYVESV